MRTSAAKLVFALVAFLICAPLIAQPPVAGFSLSPNPVCAGSVLQITDLSTGNPTSWSYTVTSGFGPGATTLTTQNPTLVINFAGTYTVMLIATNSSGASQPVVHTLTVLTSPNAQINPPLRNTCIGGNPVIINVTAGGPGGGSFTYLWSTSTSGPSITVQPTVTTTYSCVITASNGCSVVRTVTVVVGTPTINISSVPYSICPGSSSTLTATGSTPQPFTYTWSTSANTRTISTSTPGVYGVTVTNGAGCTAMQSFTLGSSSSLSLTAVANPSAVCAGSAALLSVSGAASYTWSNGSNNNQTVVTPSATTIYTVNGALGGCTGTAAINMVVNVLPTITVAGSPPSVCSGQSTTLTANGAGSYTWLPSTVSPTIAVTPSVNTTYTVRGVNAGCPARTATLNINVLAVPALLISSSASLVCAGELVALGAGGANTYTWSSGGNSAIVFVYPSATTTYTLFGTAASQCTAEVSYTQNVDPCVGLTHPNGNEITLEIYPNPSEGSFEVRAATAVKLTLFDITGRMIGETDFSAQQQVVEFNTLQQGIYVIVASDGVRSSVKKVIVAR